MRKLSCIVLALALVCAFALPAQAGMEDRFSDITLKAAPTNYVELPEISAPSGNPSTNYGWLYVKDNSGTTDLYFEDDGGTVTELTAAGSTAWDDISNPDADKTIAFDDNEITILTFADTNEDMITIQGLGAFGDVSVMRVEQKTGNATDGTVLEVVSADANVDPLVVSSSAQAGVLVVSQDGSVDITGDLDVSGAATFGSQTLTDLSVTTISASGATALEGTVTLDDGAGASPDLTFQDGTNETAVLSKEDSGELLVTTLAADGLQVMVGNLRVGDGSPGTAAMDGEDAYVNGQLEVDGAAQFDGAVTTASTLTGSGAVSFTNTLALSENVTFSVAADEYMKLDANSTANTGTAGVLDLDVQSATNTHKAVSLTYQLEDGATQAYGVYVDVDDDATGGETFDCVYAGNSAGTASTVRGLVLANTLDDGIVATLGAAGQALVVDATTTANTNTGGGLMDMAFRTTTTTAQAINIDVESDVAGGASEVVEGIHLQLDDDANTATDELIGIEIDTDGDGTGLQHAIIVRDSAGWDAGLYLEGGYLRVGTGGTPDQTLSDGDNAYFEGFIEVDGNIYADGNITGDGATEMVGVRADTVVSSGATVAVTAAETGTIFFNDQATEFDLPADPTGLAFTFCVDNASNLVIDPNGTDRIWGATDANGDSLTSSTVGDTITLVGTDADTWFVQSAYPAATDWADTN